MPRFRNPFYRFVLAVLLVVMWGIAPSGHSSRAGDYPEPVSPQPFLIDAPPQTADHEHFNPQVILRQRDVYWQAQVLAATGSDRIFFNLFADMPVIAMQTWSGATTDGGRVWIGRIEGRPDSRVTLVTHGRQASAIIWIAERRFDLRPTQGDHHVIQELDVDNLPIVALATYPSGTCGRSVDEPDRLTIAAGIWMDEEEEAVLLLVNQERAKYSDRSALSADPRLVSAARAHSQDMSDNGYFSHTSLDGRSVGERITAAGYAWSRCGENIARGYPTPEAVMSGWMNSEGHRNNILNPNYCDLGVGYVAAGRYWTQNFARLQGVVECPVALANDPEPAPVPPITTGGGSSGGCFLTTLRAMGVTD